VVVVLEVEGRQEEGELLVDGVPVVVEAGTTRIAVGLPPREDRGLAAIELVWSGTEELVVRSVSVERKVS
jgi:hypothetical protein